MILAIASQDKNRFLRELAETQNGRRKKRTKVKLIAIRFYPHFNKVKWKNPGCIPCKLNAQGRPRNMRGAVKTRQLVPNPRIEMRKLCKPKIFRPKYLRCILRKNEP